MISKIIHYCWFGGNPLPKSAQKCIDSWRKFFPNYEIKRWDESNFNVNAIPYTAEAYERKKYAFVSDYARYWILYHEGGIYFDTDVEVIKGMDDIIQAGPFMGCEIDAPSSSDKRDVAIAVNPGLGIAVDAGNELYKEILDYYSTLHFVDEQGKQLPGTVVYHNTLVLNRHGLKNEPGILQVAGINIYPAEYFNPYNSITGVLNVTDNTRSIHWYSKTWIGKSSPLRDKIVRWFHRHFGVNSLAWIKKLIHNK